MTWYPPRSPTFIHSSTHAGGIQPSSQFFYPSRPTRPVSSASSSHNDHHNLSSIQDHRYSQTSTDDPPIDSPRIKQSREPLLPTATSSSSHENTTLFPRKSNPRPVRTSFDRMLGLSRGMSLDSLRRKSIHSTHHPSSPFQTVRSPTLDSTKLPDEERGEGTALYTLSPPSDFLHSSQHHHTSPTPSSSPSPVPSFIPTPPPDAPLLARTPLRNSDHGRFIRKYELHPSRNRFLFGGRLLTGGDSPWAFMGSLTLVLGISGVWFATTCVYWWRREGPGGKVMVILAAYLAALVISSMFVTATRDPGILPRNLDLEPPYPALSPSDGGIRAPLPRDLKVRSDVVRVKYCPTCKTYRPPRSSHCKMCDNCVDGCDHHCQWVNNCVGRRNYTSFIVLLLSATTALVLIIVTSALHIFFLTQLDDINFRRALKQREGIGSAIAFCLAVAVIWPVGALLSYHLRLLLLNVTTIEQIRNQAHKSLAVGPAPPNPFSHGSWRRNFVGTLCRPQGYSWLDGSAVAVEDRRGVNPGFGFIGEGKGVAGERWIGEKGKRV